MKVNPLVAITIAFVLSLGWSLAWADAPGQFPEEATVTTLITTPRAIEGLAGDEVGNLYTVGRSPGVGNPCPVWRINLANPSLVLVGNLPAPPAPSQCSPSGLVFNAAGDLYFADDDKVLTLTPNDADPPTATVFASGVPGTNGLAFDREGNLWTGDGTTGRGRVWKITRAGMVTEAFRVQPVRNSTALGGMIDGDAVGRQARTFPPGTLTITVPPSATPTTVTPAGGQDLVANGVAFNRSGDLFIADTARGAIWRVEFDRQGNLKSRTGCDTTFTANTLCLSNIYVAHPLLEGTDGIALDRAGNIWNAANERNAVVVVARNRRVLEIFRNAPDPKSNLRNTGPLEFPTSPLLLGGTFCTANSDGNRRDNAPNTAGEINPAGPDRGKISCMDQELRVPGLPLPIQ